MDQSPVDGSGPDGRITTAGSRSGPLDESELRRTNQGPARWARDLQDEYGPFGTDKDSTRHQSGTHGTNHSLVGQTRVPRDQSGSAGQIRALRAESGSRKTNQGFKINYRCVTIQLWWDFGVRNTFLEVATLKTKNRLSVHTSDFWQDS